ncbi:MAG: UDP-N-acetylglucosamine 2-epimerase (hydrolyzing) [Bacteroidales bacterium]|nr:UDP-N-acetylglucosamine 2-epimerase (hydrolyzing) [Bacteroidales bacterium]
MGKFERLKVGVLTSSRADYSIYFPLLKKMSADHFFDLEILVFGTHMMQKFGHTVDAIYQDGFNIVEIAETMSEGDSPSDISNAMSRTLHAFSSCFEKNDYHLIIAIGDRYEMFAAVAASVPFNIPVAHIAGGETTLGAIDNGFRHSITSFSSIHFASTDVYRNRIREITAADRHIYNVGSLSIDNLKKLKLLDVHEFNDRFGINMSAPTILFTFHPETVDYINNKTYIKEIIKAIEKLSAYQLLITMPNADTMGLMIREELVNYSTKRQSVYTVESLGTLGYLSAMRHCSFMLGNTSSGFTEAAFFPKWVINLGDRQKGRIITPNILPTPIESKAIFNSVKLLENKNVPEDCNIYGDGNTAEQIITILKNIFESND